jgi:hypothetical protein
LANTYGTATFVLDTDTNVAGLTTLKGSAPALTDNICITTNAAGKPATLTVESGVTLSCLSLNIGYGAINGGTGTCGHLVFADDTICIVANSGKIYGRSGSTWTASGTAHSVGTSNGAADQTFAQLHADNWSCYVGATPEAWTWRPNLTGEMVQCNAATTSATITVLTDPRLTGLGYGQTIEIRTKADGTSKGSRVISSMTATTIVVTGGTVAYDTGDYVYLPIGATEKVYTVAGGNLVFGDGNASAWNNNGGAIPPNGDTIAQCGVTLTCQSATGTAWQTIGSKLTWTYVDMRWQGVVSSGSHLGNGSSSHSIHDIQSHHALAGGFTILSGIYDFTISDIICYANTTFGISISTGCSSFSVVRPICYANTGSGMYITRNCTSFSIENPIFYSSTSYGCFVEACSSFVILNPIAYCVSNSGLLCSSGCSNFVISNPIIYSTAAIGVYVSYNSSLWNIYGTRAYSNATAQHRVFLSDGITYGRTAATGEAGTILWRCHEMTSTGPGVRLDGDSARLTAQNEYHYSAQQHVPGLVNYGAVTTTVTTNGATVATEYRVSHNYGQTWTAWADVSTTIADTPHIDAEYIQFRVAKTDADLTKVPDHGGVSVACTFGTGWTYTYVAPGTPDLNVNTLGGGLCG